MHPRSPLIHYDDFRSKFDDLITQGRLYEVERSWILADDISDFLEQKFPMRCELGAPDVGLSKTDVPWPSERLGAFGDAPTDRSGPY